jgi:hypothetical protein
MNTIQLSKWQVELLREAFAMLAKREQASGTPSDWLEDSVPEKAGESRSPAEEERSFAI